MFNKITIIGVGLIGGSLGMCCKEKKMAAEVTGVGRNRQNLDEAVRLKAIDGFSLDPKVGVEDADLIVLATSVKDMPAIVESIIPHLKKGAIITDAGSVKKEIVSCLEAILPPGFNFVGAHPIAGKEKSGIRAASAGLYVGAKCIITPTQKTDKGALEKVEELWRCCGARVITMEAGVHDQVVALISHLPHLVAYSLVNTVGEFFGDKEDFISLSGGGFKDITRIASSNPEMWKDISLENKDYLLQAVVDFKRHLGRIEGFLKEEEGGKLLDEFEKAKRIRDGI